MARYIYPLTSKFTGYDGENNPIYDRAVDSVFFRSFWNQFFRSGVFANPSTNFQVFADDGFALRISPGWANLGGAVVMEGASTRLALRPAGDLQDRVDRIFLHMDFDDKRDMLIISRDTEHEPVRNGSVFELAIADVYVRRGSMSIAQADIVDLRLDPALCGVVTGAVESVDTGALFSQLNAFVEAQMEEYAGIREEEQGRWEEQRRGYEAWFTSVQAELPTFAGFDFENQQLYPGTKHVAIFNEDGSITDRLIALADGRVMAEKHAVFLPDANIEETQTVYDKDRNVLWQRKKATIFNADGSIEETVVNI